jgi:hypothetical protein
MKMGPRDTYLCFIPAPIKQHPPPREETITEVTASHSWSLLQPLDGTCLYVSDLSPSFSGYMTAHPQSIAKDGLLTPTAITRTFANSENCSTRAQRPQVMPIKILLGQHFLLTCWIPGKAYEIEEDPDVSASLPFSLVPFGFTLASPSGKLTTSVGHRNVAPALTWVWPITLP